MAEIVAGVRSFGGWWFVSDRATAEDSPHRSPTDISPRIPLDTDTNYNGLPNGNNNKGISKSPKLLDISKECWTPINVYDADRLETAFNDPKQCDLPEAVVIKDDSGQRLSQICLKTMTMKPVYWEGPSRNVRRSIWMQMLHSNEDLLGGIPVPPEWDWALESVYQPHMEWLQDEESTSSSGNHHVVEKIVALDVPLQDFILVLRQGQVAMAKLTPKSQLESNSSVFSRRDETVRLIRGYLPYYITVSSAIKVAQADGHSVDHVNFLPNPFEQPSNEPPRAPSSLVFAVHGIGQKLAGRMGSVFIHDCERLREQTKLIINQRSNGDLNELLILPITWRSTMYMGVKSYFPDNDEESEHEESFERLVSMITLPNIPMIRDVASDVGLDILLYMTPAYFHRIIKATLGELQRVYGIFRQVAGQGAEQCRVSLLGHSLGAAIVSDLVSFIIPRQETGRTIEDEARAVINHLGFPVDCCFALGSPLAMLFLLKQLKPIGCIANSNQIIKNDAPPLNRSVYPSLPNPSDGEEMNPRQVMFACRQFYNIFHPYDPSTLTINSNSLIVVIIIICIVAYRMEPLIIPPREMVNYNLPVRLPYLKKGALHIKRQVEQQVQTIQQKATKAKEEFVASLPDWIKKRISSPPKDLPQSLQEKSPLNGIKPAGNSPLDIVARTEKYSPLLKFNHHGRIDFAVEESLLEHSYLAAIRSHFSYWDDIDIASFVMNELVPPAALTKPSSKSTSPSI